MTRAEWLILLALAPVAALLLLLAGLFSGVALWPGPVSVDRILPYQVPVVTVVTREVTRVYFLESTKIVTMYAPTATPEPTATATPTATPEPAALVVLPSPTRARARLWFNVTGGASYGPHG